MPCFFKLLILLVLCQHACGCLGLLTCLVPPVTMYCGYPSVKKNDVILVCGIWDIILSPLWILNRVGCGGVSNG